MILNAKGSFEAKLNVLFNIFSLGDEDNEESYSLTGEDFILIIKSTFHSIFKLCKIKVPSNKEIGEYINKKFPLIFEDQNFKISFPEFSKFISKDSEIQNFLIEFFDIQTRDNAMKVFYKYYVQFESIFSQYATDEKKQKCQISKIISSVGNLLQKTDPESLKLFLEIIDPNETGFAQKEQYLNASKAVCLYMAVDKDMSHSLSQSELGILLWILNGVEPKEEKLYNTIHSMDANGDAAIELGEWLDFISSFDENGKRVINYELKEKFDKYDLDGNGTISIDEMQIMLLDSMKELLRKIGGRGKKMSEAIIEDLAKMCMKEMDVDGSDSVDWMEFKKHYKVAMKMEEKAKEYLKKFIDQGD